MPSASVSVSPVSVAVSASPSRSAAQGNAAPAEAATGFQQWINSAQNSQGTSAPGGGDDLPSDGKDLPAQRQDTHDSPVDQAQAAESDKSEDPVGGLAEAEGEKSLDDEEAELSADQLVDEDSALIVDPPVAEDQVVARASGQPAPEIEQPTQSAADREAAAPTEQLPNFAEGAIDGKAVAETGLLPEQAARPDVRAAALQNGGRELQGQQAIASPGGSPVAEVARAGLQAKTDIEGSGPESSESSESSESAADTDLEEVLTGSELLSDPQANGLDQSASEQADVQSTAASDPAIAQVSAQSARDTVSQVIERNIDPGASNARASGDAAAQAAQNQQGGQQHTARVQVELQVAQQGAQAQSADADLAGAASRNGSVLASADTPRSVDAASLGAQGQAQSFGAVQPGSGAQPADATAAALAQRLQNPAWGHAMGQRAVMMAQYGPRSAEIQLDPPELGAMQVRVQLNGKDQVSVSFTSPHPQVREAIEQQLPRLKEMFAEQGMDLSQSSVSDQSARERRDESGGDRGRQSGSLAYGDSGAANENLLNVTQAPVGLVDYYA